MRKLMLCGAIGLLIGLEAWLHPTARKPLVGEAAAGGGVTGRRAVPHSATRRASTGTTVVAHSTGGPGSTIDVLLFGEVSSCVGA